MACLCVAGCSLGPDITVSYEFQSSSESVAHLKNAYADKDGLLYRGYTFRVLALRILRQTWPTPENVVLFPPGTVADDDTSYDPINGKVGCSLDDNSMGVAYDFFCGRAVSSPPKPPVGVYRVQVGPDSSWPVEVGESRLLRSTEGVYLPLPRFVVDGAGTLVALEWTWWLREKGGWREPGAAELQNEVRYAYFEIGLEGESKLFQSLPDGPSGSFMPAGSLPFASVDWLRVGLNDKEGFEYGFEWR